MNSNPGLHPCSLLPTCREYWHWVVSGPEETIAVNTWIFSDDGLAGHLEFAEPTILPSAGRDMPAMAWTVDWIAEVADSLVDMPRSLFACVSESNSIYPEDIVSNTSVRPSGLTVFDTMDSFLGAYRDTDKYTGCYAIMQLQPESTALLGDPSRGKDPSLPLPRDERHGADLNIWLSRGLLQTGLHYDQQSNSNLILRGQKRFLVSPPDSSPYLYQNMRLDPAWNLSTREGQTQRFYARSNGADFADNGHSQVYENLAESENHGHMEPVRTPLKRRKRRVGQRRSGSQGEDN